MRSKGIAISGNFKPSPLGPIPEDWEVVRLGDIFLLIRGFSYRKSDISNEGTGIPFLTINDVEKGGGKKRSTPTIYLKPSVSISQKHCVNATSLFVANTDMSKGFIVGAPLLYDPEGAIVVYSMDLTRLVPSQKDVSLEFCFYLLTYTKMRNIVKSFGQGTNVIHLNHQLFKSLPIPLPPLPEQKRIAEVLRTVDEAIEKVDREMEHTERLKRGLMQHLLTRGIGHTRFKDSPLGKIPETWEVVRLKEITLKMFGGGTPSTNKKEYWDGDIPWITSAHIDGMYIQDGQRYISQEGVEHSSTNIVPAGNIIVATRVGIGKVAIAKIDVAISQDLTGIVVNRDRAIPEFLYWLLNFNHFGLKRFAQGSTIKGVLRSTVANMHLPLPPLPEQRRIAEILMTVDRKLELLRREKEHLQRLKKGLMDDLLTGRRRLRVEEA